jgi:oligopeptidase A
VQYFELRDRTGETIGGCYLDAYARPGKRGGAWMDECLSRDRSAAGIRMPIAHLVCNFTPPQGETPSLLSHDEVLTLLHEFGHGLHHLLTEVDLPSVGGINGVAWDVVELPSQFMENFGWTQEGLDRLSCHVSSGESLPEALHQRLLRTRHFQGGWDMLRQVELALFDLRLHRDYDPTEGGRIAEVLANVRELTGVMPPPEFDRFAHGFSHIFVGGYAAGYYSYKWAEVLSSDAFGAFEVAGVLDAETGRRFRAAILAVGGTVEPEVMFRNFRGRDPDPEALLRHSGLTSDPGGQGPGARGVPA